MTLASDWLAFHADNTPDKLALIDQDTGRRYTYAEFNDRSGRLATYMRSVWKIEPGDRIAILGKNSSEYFEIQFACMKLGAVMLPLDWQLAEPELIFILDDAMPKVLIYDDEFAARIPALLNADYIEQVLFIDFGKQTQTETEAEAIHSQRTWQHVPVGHRDARAIYEEAATVLSNNVVMSPDIKHDTPAAIMYTAGTTGQPKGAIITHGMNSWNAVNAGGQACLNHDSVNYVLLPVFRAGGFNLYANPVFHWGGTVIVGRAFDPARALKTLADPKLGVTHFFGEPATYLTMSQHKKFAKSDLSRVQHWGSGGAPMPATLWEAYAERGVEIQPGFGMAETGSIVLLGSRENARAKPTSVGRPMLHTRARVVDDNFMDVPRGEVGELLINGSNVTPGYWNCPDAPHSFTTDEHGHRWLRSGDAAKMDEEGCVYIVGRCEDMYLSGGESVSPAEVEQVILQMPEVAEVAVIGVPGPKKGKAGLAVVVVKTGNMLFDEHVIKHCKENLVEYKVPKAVVFMDALPRNAAGKVLKRELRAQYEDKV